MPSRPRRQLVIMVKEPVGGRVKTRLARDIGLPQAVRFYRHTMQAVCDRLASDPRWQTTLAVAPAAALNSRMLPRTGPRRVQSAGDLGHRMQQLLDSPAPGPVVLVGTDIPGIRAEHIWHAFRLLGANDVVFGPAMDGGFWLVGAHRVPRVREMFGRVRWSTRFTLSDVLAGLGDVRVGRVATLGDVDDRMTWDRERHAVGRRILPSERGVMRQLITE